MRALITQLEALAQQRGTLRILVDQTDMQPGLLGFSDMAEMVSDGLNQLFRLSAKLEHKDTMSAFSERSDAVAWLMRKPA